MNSYIDHSEIISPSETAAFLKLRLINPGRLPAIAESLLSRGYDAKPLRRLAAGEACSDAGLVHSFKEANQAIGGQEFASERDAATWLIQEIAGRIVERTLDAYRGAKMIWIISLAENVDSPLEAHPFIYAASEYEDRPEDRRFFTEAILEEARRLVEGGRSGQ